MNRNIINDEIQWLTEAINEQISAVKAYEGKIPQIELDMLMENVRKLYENLHLLERINDSYEFLEQKSRITPVIRPIFAGKVTESPEDEPVPAPTVVFPPSNGNKISIEYENQSEEQVISGPEVVEADLFGDEEFGFSQKLQEARDKSLGNRIRKDTDLKSSISINDKFLFINELFDGNLREYNEHIDILNSYKDLHSAFEYLDLLRKKNLWESDGKGFNRLKDLVEKQFE